MMLHEAGAIDCFQEDYLMNVYLIESTIYKSIAQREFDYHVLLNKVLENESDPSP